MVKNQDKMYFSSMIIICAAFFGAVLVLNPTTPQLDTIQVQGLGELAVEPTQATIYLGIQQEAETAELARQSAAEKMNSIISALENLGIAEDQIETSYFNIRKQYRYEEESSGYVVTNQLEVVVLDLEKLSSVIDESVKSGANQINSLRFKVSDEEEKQLKKQAIELAVKDAKEKAEAISSASGVRLVRIHTINPYSGGGYYRTAVVEKVSDTSTPIEPTDLEINQRVEIIYLIE